MVADELYWKKGNGRDYPADAKLSTIEREILSRKKSFQKAKKMRRTIGADAVEELNILRAIARDLRACIDRTVPPLDA